MTVYGFPESSNYYNGYNREAIVKVSKGGTADEIGKRIADALKTVCLIGAISAQANTCIWRLAVLSTMLPPPGTAVSA